MSAKFVHVHVHSHYSLLDGLAKIDGLVAKAKKYELGALALTDHGTLYGAIDFYQACQKAGIKPILGVEAYVAARSRFQKEAKIDARRYHLTLLAKDFEGYQNLLKLVTASHLEGFYYKPRIDKDLLREHSQGLICLSGCMGSELSKALWNKDTEAAITIIKEYQEIFGADNYYIEIMHKPKMERGLEIKAAAIELAKKMSVPLVATADVHYLEPDDALAHQTLIAIQTGTDLDDDRRFGKQEDDFSFVSPETMAEDFADTPEAIENTLAIAEKCNLEIPLGRWVFPDYPIPSGSNFDDELKIEAEAGLVKYIEKNPERADEARERMLYELGVIKTKGYSPYFLVVADLIRFARENRIFTNTRGSAAGAFVSYLIGITSVDPLFFQLPFERFLNPDRPSPPDIDMDFADKRRDEVITYAREKYGADHVAQIGTFGTMMARAAVRDVARALGYAYAVGDKIAKLIPLGSQGFPMTIKHALEITPELNELYKNDADTKRVIDLAKKIEGCARHISVHAAGVVIAPTVLTDYTAIQYDPKGEGKLITQYDMYSIEETGLLKLDFLGIRNLSILEDSIRITRKTQNIEVDIENVPLDDKLTYEMLARGETIGLFQLNGAGMTRWLKELRPTSIFDINAMVALYRPGPMQFIPDFIKRKYDSSLITYLDPTLEPILERTYGILVYQDDLLRIARKIAGYSWAEADKFRKAVGKKIPEEMKAQKERFVGGCVEHSGWPKKKAEQLWTWIEPFAAYGFNKAHSASYGRVAYQTSYMKANYPSEFMTAVLTAESGDTETVAEVIAECKRMDLPVLPPDINESFGEFACIKVGSEFYKQIGATHDRDQIRFGLYTIKNLGVEIADAIVDERKRAGIYKTLPDFLDRVKHKNLNKKSLEALIKSGAMDSLGVERGRLLANLETLVGYHQENRNNRGQDSLFGMLANPASAPQLKLTEAPAATMADRLAWEKDLLGLYVSGHPLEEFRQRFDKAEQSIKNLAALEDGTSIIVGGIVDEVKIINTKRGSRMAFVKFSDFTHTAEVVFFSDNFEKYKDQLLVGNCLALRGRVSRRNGEPSIIAESVKSLGTNGKTEDGEARSAI